MAIVNAIMRCYPRFPASPSDVLEHLNKHLYQMSVPDTYVTAFLGFLSLATGRCRYSCAAHLHPLVRDRDRSIRPLHCKIGGYPLGMFDKAHCADAEEMLEPGSLLCLYTDGIIDTASPGGAIAPTTV
jgi:serine phosphatase RsbU (regulator of sigma subunit)